MAEAFLQFTVKYKPIIDFFSALMAPVTAMIVTYIAWQQFVTSREKYRLDIYEKRIAMYRNVKTFIGKTLAQGHPTKEDIFQFWASVAEIDFLFSQKIGAYAKQLFDKGCDLETNEKLLARETNEAKREKLIEKHRIDFEWFTKQYDHAKEIFKPYLAMGK